MKEVITDAERQTLVTRLILDALYTRLTEYSTLVYSKHQKAIHDDLKTSPQFTISTKDLHFNDVKCTAKDIEQILNFFACFENDNNSPDGIYYEKMQDEYTIQTKTEANTIALETILRNIKNMPNIRIDKLYPIFTDVSKKDELIKIFRRKGSTSSFLGLFGIRQMARTDILCLHKKHEIEMFHRRRIAEEEAEQEEIEAERQRIEYENKVKQEAEKKYRQEKRNAAHARHATTDKIQEIIKKMFEIRISATPNKKTSEIIIKN